MTKKYLHGKGKINKIFPDDDKGTHHQKFSVQLKNNKSVLVIHNIGVCRRIPDLKIGDEIEFYGVYQWNRFGGLVHWTHGGESLADTGHTAGWIKYNGMTYQ